MVRLTTIAGAALGTPKSAPCGEAMPISGHSPHSPLSKMRTMRFCWNTAGVAPGEKEKLMAEVPELSASKYARIKRGFRFPLPLSRSPRTFKVPKSPHHRGRIKPDDVRQRDQPND